MKLTNLLFLPAVIERRTRLFSLVTLAGIPICSLLWYFDPLKSYPENLTLALTGGILSIAFLLASLLSFMSKLHKSKTSLIPLLLPLLLIIISVLASVGSKITAKLIYFALYYLSSGVALYLNEVRLIISEDTIGATLWDKLTYESRKQKLPYLGEESMIASKTLEGNIRINKGDTLLVKCAYIQDGRYLVRKIIKNSNYVIYITADRPYSMVMEELKDYREKIFCIDCFTNVYGFGEFKEVKGESNSFTLKPTTVKELHERLREVRKQIIAAMYYNKDWSSLSRQELREITIELSSKEATFERDNNIWIIYDSISSLAAIFDMEPLLMFLIHDTTVDTTIGRNTLLLTKDGALGQNLVSRLESFSEHIFSIKVDGNKICVNIDRSDDLKSSKEFCINI